MKAVGSDAHHPESGRFSLLCHQQFRWWHSLLYRGIAMSVSLVEPLAQARAPDKPRIGRVSQKQQAIIGALAQGVCLFPGCSERLLEVVLVYGSPPYGFRIKNVGEFAHIRSPRPDGPRYDPDYPEELLNTYFNVFNACLRHHTVVDDPACGAVFTVRVLEAWIDDSVRALIADKGNGGDIRKTLLRPRYIWSNRRLREQLEPVA